MQFYIIFLLIFCFPICCVHMYHIPSHTTFDPWFNIYSFHFMIELNYRQPALIIRHMISVPNFKMK